MKYDSNLVRFIILAPILPEYFVAFLVFRRHLQRDVPWFTIYLLLEATSSVVMFALYENGDQVLYFVTSWLVGFSVYAVAFLVMTEVFRNLLSGYSAIRNIGLKLLFGAGVVLLVAALFVGPLGTEHTNSVMKMLLLLKRGIMLIQLGMVVVMFAFSHYLGLGWRNHQFGIVLGYGLFAAVAVAEIAYVAQIGAIVSYNLMFIEQGSYFCTILIWMIYFLLPSEKPPSLPPDHVRPELERWNEALTELLSR